MKRSELEHIIRASAATSNQREIVVIGSQAILGSFPEAPKPLSESMEADVFPKNAPELAIVIDGAIGEMSMFHRTFGYFAHGVDDTTAKLPPGWRERLVLVENPNTMGARGWCLEPHDLAVSKLAAGREKDLIFVQTMVEHGFAEASLIALRFAETSDIPKQIRDIAEARLQAWKQ